MDTKTEKQLPYGHNYFKPIDPDSDDLALRLTASSKDTLDEALPPIELPLETILKKLADSQRSDSESDVEQAANGFLDMERVRAKKTAIAEATVSGCDEVVNDCREKIFDREAELDSLPKTISEPVGKRRTLFSRDTIEESTKVTLFGGLCLILAAMDLTTMMNLVRDSGYSVGESPWSAFCFCGIYLGGPLILFQFAYTHASDESRQWIVNKLGVVATVTSLLGIWIFAVIMGGQQGDVDIVSGQEESQNFYWFLSGFGMTLLATTLLATKVTIAEICSGLQRTKSSPHPARAGIEVAIVKFKNAIRETTALRLDALGVLNQLAGDRCTFVIELLSAFRSLSFDVKTKREAEQFEQEEKRKQQQREEERQRQQKQRTYKAEEAKIDSESRAAKATLYAKYSSDFHIYTPDAQGA
ncbi:MAG: hypothetical protein GXP26_13265 [Planctomycetes bacterium]|nr:hypothetical protein [Planctomycetota bacterium]